MRPSSISSGIYADSALTPDGWFRDMSIYFDTDGSIKSVRPGYADPDLPVAAGPVIPGMVNIHSHAFQRGMVGRTQVFSDPDDDFWSWRKAMYDFVIRLNPDTYRVQAEALYREMVEHGYTSVCEFHYIHNEVSGKPYSDPAAMSIALIEAAESAGIRLCLLPVLYTYGGFDQRELTGGQLRFGKSVPQFLKMMDRLNSRLAGNSTVTLGYAPHSLRAVSKDGMEDLIAHRNDAGLDSPIHIHVAEQLAEVKECLQTYGARPVEYLLSSAEVDSTWCLIHATHIEDFEIKRVSASGAVVGLCPTTESDLGDGVFPLRKFVRAGGKYGLGSDSNVSVSPGEEIRCLESMQRSSLRLRNVDGAISDLGVATIRYQNAVSGGLSVSGHSGTFMTAGSPADLVVLNASAELLAGKTADEMLNAHLLSGSNRSIDSVYTAGRKIT